MLFRSVTDAEYLYLVVTDAGDNYNYDHGNWINPVLIDNNGKETLLTSLDWESATSGWDVVKKNKNVDGGALVVNGTSYDNGLGVNANSIIKYKLTTGHNYKTFNTFCGYDSDMDSAPNGVTIEFMVFTEDPAPNNSEAVTLDLRSFGYEEGQECNIRDMWKGIDLGIFINDQFAPEIKEHGSGVYRITPVTRKESSTINISTDKSVYDANDTIEVNISTSGKGDGWIQIIINDEIAGAFAPEESGSAKYYGSGFYKGDYKIRAN